jgi:hypothetical protein
LRTSLAAIVGLLLALPCEAAVTFHSYATSGQVSSTAANQTVTEPATCVSGNMEVAIAVATSGTSLAMPAGWTTQYGPTTQGAMMFVAGYVQRGGSAPNLTWTVVTGGVSKYREVHVMCLQGAANVTFDAASTTGATGNGINHQPDPSAVVAVATTSLEVTGGINFGGLFSGGSCAETGYTVRSQNLINDDCCLATKALAAAGSDNPAAYTGFNTAGAQDWWDGFAMTFTDGVTVPTRTLLGVGKLARRLSFM